MTTPPPDTLQHDFRAAMRRLASTVAIITSAHDGEWSGMIATAVTAVSSDPPSLVIGVNRSASLHQPITAGERFCVNLLSTQHADLVAPFSGKLKGKDRFALGAWTESPYGIPALADAMVNFFCRVDAKLDYASHTLFIGSIDSIQLNGETTPLIWQEGALAFTVPLATRTSAR